MGPLSHRRYWSFIKSNQVFSHYFVPMCVMHLSPLKYQFLWHAKQDALVIETAFFFNDPCCVRVNVSPLGPNCKASTDPWLILQGKHCKAGWGTSENSNRLWLHNSCLYCWGRTEISDPLKSLGNRNYSISQQHQVFTSLSLNQESPDLRLLWPLPLHSSAIILTSFL